MLNFLLLHSSPPPPPHPAVPSGRMGGSSFLCEHLILILEQEGEKRSNSSGGKASVLGKAGEDSGLCMGALHKQWGGGAGGQGGY